MSTHAVLTELRVVCVTVGPLQLPPRRTLTTVGPRTQRVHYVLPAGPARTAITSPRYSDHGAAVLPPGRQGSRSSPQACFTWVAQVLRAARARSLTGARAEPPHLRVSTTANHTPFHAARKPCNFPHCPSMFASHFLGRKKEEHGPQGRGQRPPAAEARSDYGALVKAAERDPMLAAEVHDLGRVHGRARQTKQGGWCRGHGGTDRRRAATEVVESATRDAQ